MELERLATVVLRIKDADSAIEEADCKNVLELRMPLYAHSSLIGSCQHLIDFFLLNIIQHDVAVEEPDCK